MTDKAYTFVPGKDALSPVYVWDDGVEALIDPKARQQITQTALMPFIHHHVAVMPDAHWGLGATIGSVVATKGAIIPAAVGVDIGCGMMARRLNLKASDLPDNLDGVRSAIEKAVPHGRTDNGGVNDRGAWGEAPRMNRSLMDELRVLVAKHLKLTRAAGRAPNHMGTLGGGNHFIEVCLDENDDVWIMLHSGSRGIGNAIGRQFITLAKEEMQRWHIHLPDADLAYLPEGSEHFDDYVEAVQWAQDFALLNRRLMMYATVRAIWSSVSQRDLDTHETAVECHHNYIAKEHHFGSNVWVTRKGAVRARKGDLGIIPGSMGAKSFITRGLGNPDSFHSCAHGAGRVMSRREAKRVFTVEDHIAATEGVSCRKDESVLDETPGAYKPIDAVMAAQGDLCEVVHTLHQVVCVKG